MIKTIGDHCKRELEFKKEGLEGHQRGEMGKWLGEAGKTMTQSESAIVSISGEGKMQQHNSEPFLSLPKRCGEIYLPHTQCAMTVKRWKPMLSKNVSTKT